MFYVIYHSKTPPWRWPQ